jgi:sugar lactone lactonase YvrE/DNA-directed RNA polymerase subunit RPC12/RpoP
MAASSQTFQCPSCGAPLEPLTGQGGMKCAYCGSTVIIPEALRVPSSASGKPGNVSLPDFDFSALAGKAGQIAKVVHLARSGNKDEAIRIFMKTTGNSLEESREVIDAIAAGQPIAVNASGQLSFAQRSIQIPAQTTRKISGTIGCLLAAVIIIAIVGVAAPFLIAIPGIAALFNAKSLPPSVASIIPPGIVATPTPSFAHQVLVFGEQGSGAGMLDDPRDIGVDRHGNIYVGDYQDGRVQIFDSQGVFLRQINIGDNLLFGLAVNPDGTLYLSYDGEIRAYNGETGEAIGQIPVSQDHRFGPIAVTADGKLVAVSMQEDILRFSPDGVVDMNIPAAISSISHDTELDTRIAVDGLGNVYALGAFNDAVFKYDSDGNFVDRFGGETENPAQGFDPGHFQAPIGIAADGYGRVYVSDIWGIQVFDSDGQYLDYIDLDEGAAFGLAFDLNNNLFVASNANQVLQYQVQKP